MMDKMINYIFSTLHDSENAVKYMERQLKGQTKINKRIAIFALIMTTYAVLAEINNQERDKKIKKLRNELEELKRTEGE